MHGVMLTRYLLLTVIYIPNSRRRRVDEYNESETYTQYFYHYSFTGEVQQEDIFVLHAIGYLTGCLDYHAQSFDPVVGHTEYL